MEGVAAASVAQHNAWAWMVAVGVCVWAVPTRGLVSDYRPNWCHCDLDPCLEQILAALLNNQTLPDCSPESLSPTNGPNGTNGTLPNNNGTSTGNNGTSTGTNGTSAGTNGTTGSTNGTAADTNGTAADTNGTAADTNGTSSGTNGTAADANGTTSGTNDTSTGTNSTSTATNGTSPGTNNGNNGNNGSNSTANSTSTGTTNGTNTTASGATSTNGTNTTATGATSTNGTNTTATGATSTNGTNTTTTGTTSTNGTNTTTTGAASTNGTNTTATGTTSTNGTNTTSSSNSTTTNSTTNANGTSGTNSTRRKRSVADGDEELVEAVDGGQVLLQVTQAPDEVPEVPDEVPQVPDEVDEDCDLDTEVKRIAQINQIADDVIREGGQNEVIEEGSGTASEDRIGGPDGIVISRRRKRDTDLTSSYGGVVIVSPFRTVTKTVVDKGVLFRTNGTTSLCSCTPGSVLAMTLCLTDLHYTSDLANTGSALYLNTSRVIMSHLHYFLSSLKDSDGMSVFRRLSIPTFTPAGNGFTTVNTVVQLTTVRDLADFYVATTVQVPTRMTYLIANYATDSESCLGVTDITPVQPPPKNPLDALRYIAIAVALVILVGVILIICVGKRDACSLRFW
ncbi:mucin-22 [Procambarus clarkii]|uniref:mucin-22 n=1 Tax=Procambarus clarkii TaxID=6728 RepID=UPI00374213D6